MGGRGASSGLKRGISNSNRNSIGSIDDRLKVLDNQIEEINKQLEFLSDKIYPHQSGYSEENNQKYYDLQSKKQDINKKRSNLLDEKVKNQPKQEKKEHKTFVNSFGEATKREITSASEKRAQKRLDKAILRNMGY